MGSVARMTPGRGRPARAASALAAGLAALVGLALAARSAAIALRLSTPVPYEDQWEFVGDLMRVRDGDYGFLDLFSLQNEHRIFTARLSFFADYYLFHLGNLSVVVTTYVVLAVLAGVMARVAARGRPLWVGAAVLAVVLASLWSLAGWINLGWAFQLQWAYVHALPALAIVLFAAAGRRAGRGAWAVLAGACLADALGAFSMASGLCTIVPVAAVALWTRTRPALLGTFALVHALVVVLYLQGYVASDHAPVFDLPRLVAYVVPYLGTALPGSPTGSLLLGAVGLVLALAAMAIATLRASRGRPCETGVATLLGIAGFVLAEGVVTGVGRAGSPDPLASALRYGTPSEVFWTALALCAWRWLTLRDAPSPARDWAARALAAAAVCGVLAGNLTGSTHANWTQWSGGVGNEGFNLINGVTTGPSALQTYPRPELIQDRFAFLRERRLGPFAPDQGRFRIPHARLDGLLPAALPACGGATDLVEHRDGSVHVRGWAVTKGLPRSAIGVAAIDGAGMLHGYAATWELRWDEHQVSGTAIVEGYDFWFREPDGPTPRAIDLVALFPPGTAPPCRAAPAP